ncbi:restriction endonuclease subunit S [Paracoccus jeotgali]|uniref:restriction endonuclease subunit S n=1 Tax=Paracoccus jeotgali TaxID=2065379 RepID=UPI0028AC4BD7|nr:restriction endonuclease subunit S [Paracoccus jeotgali]
MKDALQPEIVEVCAASWPIVPLGEVCRIELGKTPARGTKSNWDEDKSTGNVWLSIADMPTSLHAEATESREHVSETAAREMRLVPEGTLLVSFKLTLGRLCYAGRDLFTNEAIAAILDLDEPRVLKPFLYWYLTYFDWDAAAAGDHKIKGKTLNKAKLKALPIPLPPLDEQKRIVGVLDQAFAALDRARAHAEANIADADALFESGLDRLLENHSEVGVRTHLGNICRFENGDRGKNYPGRKAFVPEGVPFINAGHLEDGEIIWEAMNFIPEEHYKRLSKGKVKEGDLLFCLRGSLGKFGKVDRAGLGAIASSLVIVRTGDDILTDYLGMYFKSKSCREMIEKFAGGAAQPNLSAGDLKRFDIVLPDLDHQTLAVETHDLLWDSTKDLQANYKRKLMEFAALRQSILQRAFSGELS